VPHGADARVSAPTMNRWRQDYLAEWFEALVTPPRQVEALTPEEVLTLAALNGRTRSGRLPCQADPHRAVWMIPLGSGAAAPVRLAGASRDRASRPPRSRHHG
jgi:hypothetical protein